MSHWLDVGPKHLWVVLGFSEHAPGYYSIVLRYLVLVSLSFLWKCVICCGSSSTECGRLCLKWLTSFLHFAKALSNVLFLRLTVMARWTVCAIQGICSNGNCLAAAIKLQALPVVSVLTLCSMFHCLATCMNCSAHMLAKCLSSVFITVKACELSSHCGPN